MTNTTIITRQFGRRAVAVGLAAILGIALAGCGNSSNGAQSSSSASSSSSAADQQSDSKSAGFEEIPIYDAKGNTDIEVGPLNVAAVYFQPIDMEPAGMGLKAADSNLHLEADIHALKNNNLGYGAGEFVPGLTVDYTIADKNDSSNTQEGTFMEMVASDGPHYGANLKLDKDGEYTLTLKIHSPAENGWMLHVDPETGVKGHYWTEPLTATFDWDYTVHQW